MKVTSIVPATGAVDLHDLIAGITEPGFRREPFGDATIGFCSDLSRALFRDEAARRYPELQALAFWMRRSELLRLKDEFLEMGTGATTLVPRGLVFHLPPSNVDTIFMYSWIAAVLVGNSNIIRLSERAAEPALIICRVLGEMLPSADLSFQRSTAIVQYPRNDAITAAISAACDVRVIWGGDATVNAIRGIAVPPHATELTFPDRSSLAVLNSGVYATAAETVRDNLAAAFYNDTFWFDQMGCSSPRLMAWIGGEQKCDRVSDDFFRRLELQVNARDYRLAPGPRLNKLTFVSRAILDHASVTRARNYGPAITVLELSGLDDIPREHCGGGLIYRIHTPSLTDLAPVIERRHQTLTHFGFEDIELRGFIRLLNGQGIDRLVPVGQALTFNRFWDGYDLLREFTRSVYLQV